MDAHLRGTSVAEQPLTSPQVGFLMTEIRTLRLKVTDILLEAPDSERARGEGTHTLDERRWMCF